MTQTVWGPCAKRSPDGDRSAGIPWRSVARRFQSRGCVTHCDADASRPDAIDSTPPEPVSVSQAVPVRCDDPERFRAEKHGMTDDCRRSAWRSAKLVFESLESCTGLARRLGSPHSCSRENTTQSRCRKKIRKTTRRTRSTSRSRIRCVLCTAHATPIAPPRFRVFEPIRPNPRPPPLPIAGQLRGPLQGEDDHQVRKGTTRGDSRLTAPAQPRPRSRPVSLTAPNHSNASHR